MLYTETAVPIEELLLRESIKAYCGRLGNTEQTDTLFHYVSRTLGEYCDQNSEEYWVAMELVAKQFSDSADRMKRNMAVVPGHRPKKTVSEDCEFFIEEARINISNALREREHRALPYSNFIY